MPGCYLPDAGWIHPIRQQHRRDRSHPGGVARHTTKAKPCMDPGWLTKGMHVTVQVRACAERSSNVLQRPSHSTISGLPMISVESGLAS
jgi:hypothetical protein